MHPLEPAVELAVKCLILLLIIIVIVVIVAIETDPFDGC